MLVCSILCLHILLFDVKAILQYSFKSNITQNGNPDIRLNEVSGIISLFAYPLSKVHNGGRILFYRAQLENNDRSWKRELEAVAEFQSDGMLRQIRIPVNMQLETTELNLLRGIISLFVLRTNLEAGEELDSAGMCHVSYAIVEKAETAKDEMVFDKFKRLCKPIHQPLDVWNRDLVPIRSLRNPSEMFVRYWLDKKHDRINRILAHEKLEYSLLPTREQDSISVVSWQELALIAADKDVPVKDSNEVSNMAQKILQSGTYSTHLSLTLTWEADEHACTLNHQLRNDSRGDDDRRFPLTVLLSAVENARDALQADQVVSIEPLHQIIQLVWLFRCLPNSPSYVDRLIKATMLGPPAIEAHMLHRQANTWRDQLVEVLISCGTETCTEVVINRLSALTDAAAVNIHDGSALSTEEALTRKMLFSHMWPKVGTLRELRNSTFEKIMNLCTRVVDHSNRLICLSAITNLWSGVYPKVSTVYETLIEWTRELLRVDRSDLQDSDLILTNSRLMSGISMAVKLDAIEVLNILTQISMETETVLSPVRAAALRAISAIIQRAERIKEITESEKIALQVQLSDNFMYRNSSQADDILLETELFTTLMMLNLTTDEVSKLFTTLREQKRLELLGLCYKVILRQCKLESLELNACACLGQDTESCDRRLAIDWSVLATPIKSAFGQVTSIYGDFVNLNNSLIIEYALHTVNGAGAEMRHSNLEVNLLTSLGETKLGQLCIYAHALNTLAGIQSTGAAHGDIAWVNIEFEALATKYTPWTIFSGGVSEMISKLWSAPSEPSTIFSSIQPIIDRREYAAFASGWLLSLNTIGLLAIELSGAVETNIWSQSGRSLVRTDVSLACEIYLHIIDEFARDDQATIRGFGLESRIDFINNIKVSQLPSGVCMSMNRDETRLWKWNTSNPIPEFRPSGREHFNSRELLNRADYRISDEMVHPGVSYNLGDGNSRRCNRLRSKNLW